MKSCKSFHHTVTTGKYTIPPNSHAVKYCAFSIYPALAQTNYVTTSINQVSQREVNTADTSDTFDTSILWNSAPTKAQQRKAFRACNKTSSPMEMPAGKHWRVYGE